ADSHHRARDRNAGIVRQMAQVGDGVGLRQAKVEQRPQRLRAGRRTRAAGEQLQGLRPALRPDIGEGRGLHRFSPVVAAPRAAWIAASTRDGLAGRSVTSAPSGARASLMALTMAAGGPIAPLSPMPFWPKVVHGLGVSMWSSRTSGTSVVPGSR